MSDSFQPVIIFKCLCILLFYLATPGRLVDHLENTKGFNLRSLKYLVGAQSNDLYPYNVPFSYSSYKCKLWLVDLP